ncbi:MAG: DUF4573 domain-containing protein [Treponema sp.]|nr:DUF4573 domain-containing protein [Treponema sp.]
MTSGQKTALSVLISVMLFGAFAVAAFAGLFSAIDARFYEPAKISQIDKKLQDISAAYDDYLKTLNERFALGQNAFLKNSSVQTFVEAKPSDQDVLSRGEALGELRSGTQGFLGLRVLDKNQNSIHYSTFHSDILRRDEKNNLTAYKNYLECLSLSGKEEIAAQIVSCSDTGGDLNAGKKIYFDQENRIVISFPLYDRYSVFRGSAIFYVNALDFANVLLKKNLISIGETVSFLSNGLVGADCLCGYAFGLPSVGQEDFAAALFDAWKKNSGAAERLLSLGGQSKNFWVAVSQKAKSGVFVCGVYNDEIFALPPSARILILICVFVSIFLVCFLLLNLRRDDETVIRERIKTLQLGVVDEYLSKKEELNWETISGRRDAVTKEIIQSLGGRAKKRQAQVEELINRSWDELFAAMNLRPKDSSGGAMENAQEIKAMLQELLSNGALKVQAVQAPPSASAAVAPAPAKAAALEPQEAEPLEEVEEIEEVEEVEDAEPVEEAEEVEALEEVEEAEPVEALEKVEEAEPVEEAEEVEALEEVEDAEPVEEAEEVEALEEVEEAEPVEDAQPVEEFESVDASDFLDGIEDAQTADDAQPVEEAEPVEDLEEVESFDELHEDLKNLAADLSAKEEGDIDISEDVSADFFALRPKKEGADKKPKEEGVVGDKDLDPYTNVRDSFAPNDETEEVVKNFSVIQPDFTDLDARADDEKVNGTLEGEKSDWCKELSPEDFGVSVKEEKEEFSEPLEFSAPQNNGLDDGTDVASTFTTEAPSFDRNPRIHDGDKNKAQDDPVSLASAPEAAAIPLSNTEAFMFSSFGQNAKAAELQAADYNAIVQDKNGVFSIVDGVNTQGVVQDNSFKRLVDSVLNNS